MTVNYSEDTPIPFFIGGDPGTGNATEHFNGYIDDVALFNVALTSNQVATVYGGDYSDWYGPSEAPVIGCTISGGDMIVTWDATGFKLQIRESLQFGDWVDYPGGDSSPVTVPATNDVEFMRLIEQ